MSANKIQTLQSI